MKDSDRFLITYGIFLFFYELPIEIQGKVTQLETAASALKSKAGADAGQVGTVASTLAGNAVELNTAAGNISGAGLTALSEKANAPKDAAKKDQGDTSSLHHHAQQLKTTPANYGKAIAVITAFKTVNAAYEKLAKQKTYKEFKDKPSTGPESPEAKVQNVEGAWEGVKGDFEKLCNALINHFAGLVETKATALQSKKTVEKAQAFKDKYDEFKFTDKSTISITDKGTSGTTKTITITNLPHINDTFKPRQIKFGDIIWPSIIAQWELGIIDIAQKAIYAYSTDEKLKEAAGTGSRATTGTLRQLATQLYEKASELNTAVTTTGEVNAAKVLKHKAGSPEEEGKLRKLAADLYSAAKKLETAAPGDSTGDNAALKLKAGSKPEDGLRGLAKDLYDAANELEGVAVNDERAASSLATAVGATETTPGIRQALKQLATETSDIPGKASTVRTAYKDSTGNGVEKKFTTVEKQATAYTEPEKQAVYQAVVTAWNAFNTLYTTDLKELAQQLKDAVGTESQSEKLQGALKELATAPDGPGLTGLATKVTQAYESGTDGVKDKFTSLQALGPSYQAIAAIQPKYEAVEKAMTAFDNVYKPEELLATAVGDRDEAGTVGKPTTLREALYQLGSALAGATDLVAKANAVKKQYGDNWGDDVKGKFHLVQAQAPAYEQGNKTSEYKGLLDAWTNFNDKYYKAVSYYKCYSIVVPSIYTVCPDCSPQHHLFHKVGNANNGFGGWRQYKKHIPTDPPSDFKCNTVAESESQNIVHNWFWHFFDILIVIKITLAAVFIYSLHYRESNSYQ